MEKSVKSVSIVGAGIVGLAHAYAYAKRGFRVRVFERSPRAAGASIRNFGMLWPIGQPAGDMHEMALLSRRLWLELLAATSLPHFPDGSLHLAYHEDEETVACEFAELEPARAQWISAADACAKSPAVRAEGLRGALFSSTEVVVDPRLALWTLPEYLDEKFGVEFAFSTAVTDVRKIQADRVVVCSGHDFETLHPPVFATSELTRCKLQMMRTEPQPSDWRMGPALAAGLTLRFYPSFRICPGLEELRRRIAEEMPAYERWGIHVMAAPSAGQTITLGDSHEYGLDVDAFNREEIDNLILRYLSTFAQFPNPGIAQRWHGVYSKHPRLPYFTAEPEPGVRVVTGLGGAGMTLAFGLAEILTANELGDRL
jgi:D-hydroxyproline dehydrogenase subunit beta